MLLSVGPCDRCCGNWAQLVELLTVPFPETLGQTSSLQVLVVSHFWRQGHKYILTKVVAPYTTGGSPTLVLMGHCSWKRQPEKGLP